jgi:glycosyltransferase involved in cell wall biosynthesis
MKLRKRTVSQRKKKLGSNVLHITLRPPLPQKNNKRSNARSSLTTSASASLPSIFPQSNMERRLEYDRYRVLFIIDQFNIGGTETHCLTLARQFLQWGMHVVIAGQSGKLLDNFFGLGCPVYEINFMQSNSSNHHDLLAVLKQIIVNENISLIHTHQIPSGRIVAEAAKQLRVPYVFTVHGMYYDKESLIEHCNQASAIISVSPATQQMITKCSKTSPVLIPNGISLTEYSHRYSSLRCILDIPANTPLILYSCRMAWEKTHICQQVIEAVRELRKTSSTTLQLVIAGSGSDIEQIEEIINMVNNDEGESFIHLISNRMNTANLYSSCQCVIGTGRIAAEAMACGVPVIAAGSSGYFGVVRPEQYEFALQCWFGDHAAPESLSSSQLTRDIEEILNSTDSVMKEQGWAGKNYIEEHLNIQKTAKLTLDIYKSIISCT